MSVKLRNEISVVAGIVLACINAIQISALTLPDWAHTLIAVVSIVAGSLVVRQNVIPAPAPMPAAPPPAPPKPAA